VHNIVSDQIRVIDEQMRDVPADGEAMGEVVMRGNNVMNGYFSQPGATAAAFAGGWFHSGDIGVMHPDGYIELRDRKKDIIISGGENISTIEVDHTLCRHPAVLECAVVAIPDEKWGERPKAFVTLAAGKDAHEQEIIEFCREHLAHFKAPAAVEFVPLPKTSTGKVQKYVLRDREWARHDKRVARAHVQSRTQDSRAYDRGFPPVRQLHDSSRTSAARRRCYRASLRFRSSGEALAGPDRHNRRVATLRSSEAVWCR
jgi:acyl-CoA synthetase (AMP-forming)/AMP-acid ligase II